MPRENESMIFPKRPAPAVRCPREGRSFRQLLCALVLLTGGALLMPSYGRQPQVSIPAYAGPLIAAELTPGAARPSTAAWQPMQGSLPLTIVREGERRALRLPCNFKGTEIERASWDRPVQLDLSACRGLRFDVYCADSSPISSFSLYLHSRSGWYVV